MENHDISNFQQNITFQGTIFFPQLQPKDYESGKLYTQCPSEIEATSCCWHKAHFSVSP